ncbi:MAG: methyltransferase domain-containing protein [Planctomycetota bacterium]|jgi:hypothetical protein
MPLVDVELPQPRAAELPARIGALIRESDRRTRRFLARRAVSGFVASDFERVGRALQAVREANLGPGGACCEWGSGFGVVALMAACLDFQACGIEINADLVDEATALANEFQLDVEFACGTYVPQGGEDLTDACEEFDWLSAGGACGYDALGVDPADFDLIFAYPWPGEEQVIDDLFERYGAVSALLLTYHGGREDVRLRRKVADGPQR